ncbi:MAG: hypothetical protein EOP47_23760 [Sphingobacteriaceae bacterium]|nr:MAG: hypothetical protein EOP47_23760 [Sphingobacteriaceae bacterium]
MQLGGSILPANAGYINGDINIAVDQKTDYNMPVVADTYYKWIINGPATAVYGTNNVTLSWKQPGKYTVQAIPYTNCGLGKSRTIEVNVESVPEPKIIGPATVESYSKAEYYTIDNGNTYNWKLPGNNNTAANKNKFSVIWANPDTAVIDVVETNKRLNLKKAASLTVIILAPKTQNSLPKIHLHQNMMSRWLVSTPIHL